MTRRVVITGLGLVCGLGNTAPEVWQQLMAGASGMGPIQAFDTTGFTTTFAGAIPEKSSFINGVVYAVTEQELKATNQREQGYTPTDITDTVQILSGSYKPKDKVWIYVNDFKNEKQRLDSLPTPQFPLVQSYIDICLTGCLQIEQGFPEDAKGFADEFITSTQEWSKYWENDRAYPRRAPFTVPSAQDIDKLLQKHLPKLFAEIQLAPGRW